MTVVRVASVNCLHGLDVRDGPPGPVDTALRGLAATIARLDADIVALQEVDRGLPRSGGVDQVAVLADALGLHGVFAPALAGDPDDEWTTVEGDGRDHPGYGVGLLSRLPPQGVTRVTLPGGGPGRRAPREEGDRSDAAARPGWDGEPRTALRVDVVCRGRPVAVTTTHLSYLPWRGLLQLRSAGRVAARAAQAAVLVGDLNLPALVASRALPGWRHAGGEPTYPAGRPRAQLDHVLVRGAVGVSIAQAGPPTTSDHLPLVADLLVDP